MDSIPAGARRALFAVAALVACVLVAAAIGVAYDLYYSGRVLPGVTATGIPLGGLSIDAAATTLAGRLPATAREIALRDPADGRTWRLPAADLGLSLDPDALAETAAAVGRSGTRLIARPFAPLWVRLTGRDILAAGAFDRDRARATLEALAPEVATAPQNAGLQWVDGKVVDQAPVFGRQLDVDGTLAKLADLAWAADEATLELAVLGTSPRVFDVSDVSEAFRRVTTSPLTVNLQGRTVAVADPAVLASWVALTTTTNAGGDTVPAISFDRAAVRRWVEPLATKVDRSPSDARFRYDLNGGKVSVLQADHAGYRLDVDGTVARIVEGTYGEQRVVEVVVAETRAAVPAGALGRLSAGVDVLGRAYTGFAGAPPGRMQNMLVAAGRLDGVAIASGATFSLLARLGDVSAAAGFDMGHVSAGAAGDAAPYGGGLEQVATTVFRAAVWGGFPIPERHAPAARVPWLEPPIGLDAAVGAGAADLQFVNDSGEFVFVEATLDTGRSALVFTIYGLPRERQVELFGPQVSGLVPASLEVVGRRTDSLAAGVTEQVAWAREGADTTVERVVTADGQPVLRDMFTSRYAPAGDLVLTGTGAD